MKAELKKNSLNQLGKGTIIFEEGDDITGIGLVVKGRAQIHAEGVNLVVGSGNFLGLCDLLNKTYNLTYTADTNLAIYSFPVTNLGTAIRGLIKVNKDYAPLLVSTLSKYIRELSKILDELEESSDITGKFIRDAYQRYLDIGKRTGARTMPIRAIEEMKELEKKALNTELIEYYRACAELSPEIQKAYFGTNATITIHHILEQVYLVRNLLERCRADAQYLKKIANPLVVDARSLCSSVLQQAGMLQRAGESVSEATSLLDDVIDRTNSLENLLSKRADVELGVDHDAIDTAYMNILNGGSASSGSDDSGDRAEADISDLVGSLDQILAYGGLEEEKETALRDDLNAFMALSDKYATEEDARNLRRNLIKVYYELYQNVFLKDYQSGEETPLVIDLFLRYGLLSEELISENIQRELVALDRSDSGGGACTVYDMKEWLTLVLEGKKEPSKSEFDMDYDESLRDMKKNGQITQEQQEEMSSNLEEKFSFEVQNMFRTNHRILFGQITAFVPFLFTESCSGSLNRSFLSKDKLNAAVQRLLHIDYSVFYRESLYGVEGPFVKEYVQEEVFPDIIAMPVYGSKTVMWQELSGRRRNSKGRFIVPIFMEGDLDSEMTKLFGRFRWELCRTIQGSSWNNIQLKSLTSEYGDFIQFYRKNRELSDDKKEKLKLQIQKCRNNSREVFVLDYENWIRHESQGGLLLSKPVREILATYCPFTKEIREKIGEQPMFRDAMARFSRERAKHAKEYDLRFRVWEKDGVEVPEEVVATKRYYTEY